MCQPADSRSRLLYACLICFMITSSLDREWRQQTCDEIPSTAKWNSYTDQVRQWHSHPVVNCEQRICLWSASQATVMSSHTRTWSDCHQRDTIAQSFSPCIPWNLLRATSHAKQKTLKQGTHSHASDHFSRHCIQGSSLLWGHQCPVGGQLQGQADQPLGEPFGTTHSVVKIVRLRLLVLCSDQLNTAAPLSSRQSPSRSEVAFLLCDPDL